MEQTIELISNTDIDDICFFYKTALRKQTLVFNSIFVAACLIFLVKAILDGGVMDWVWLSYSVFGLIWYGFRPVRVGKRVYKKRVAYYNGNPPASTVRFADQIEITDIDSSYKIPYDKVKEAQFVKQFLLMTLETKAMYMFKLDHFVSGDEAALRQLLKEKCTQSNPAKWQW